MKNFILSEFWCEIIICKTANKLGVCDSMSSKTHDLIWVKY